MEYHRPLIRFATFASALTLVGTLGYMRIEGWSVFDALYMTVITLSTVGFDSRPLSTAGRAFTMLLIVGGVGSLAYFANAMARYIASGTLTGIFRSRRMQHAIDQLRDHYIVCGYGRVGRQVATDLSARGHAVVIVERDATPIGDLDATTMFFVTGDASDDDVLARAGIGRARGLVAATGEDATNLFITVSARALNPAIQIVARCTTPATEAKLRRAGATHVVSPYAIGGHRMAAQILMPRVTEFLDITLQAMGTDLWLEEVMIGDNSPLIGRTIGEAFPRSPDGANVIALLHGAGGAFLTNPGADVRIGSSDVVIALGTREQLRHLVKERSAVPA